MKNLIILVLILIAPAVSHAGLWNSSDELEALGYLARTDGTKVYERSEGDAVAAKVHKDFPFVAFESRNSWLGIMATESIQSGRAHVRYWKNGLNATNGENTAWVDLKDVRRIQFACCGDNSHCSGIKASFFKPHSFTDCFTQAIAASIDKKAPAASEMEKTTVPLDSNQTYELEKLKLQLEIEKLRLELERLKSGRK